MRDKVKVSIVLCTDDEEIENIYRPLEYDPGMNVGIPGVDVTEDYRGELRDVRRLRGRQYRFTFGDYIGELMYFIFECSVGISLFTNCLCREVKTLVGAVDPTVHLIDLPERQKCIII